jgi:uncharacterized protein YegP (UPF0339 family)
MRYKIQYYKGKRGWCIRIIAKNGKIVADGGESYSSKSNVVRACKRLQEAIPSAKIEMK